MPLAHEPAVLAHGIVFKKAAVKGEPCDGDFQRSRLFKQFLLSVKPARTFQHLRIQHIGREIYALRKFSAVGAAPLQKNPPLEIFQQPEFVFKPREIAEKPLRFPHCGVRRRAATCANSMVIQLDQVPHRPVRDIGAVFKIGGITHRHHAFRKIFKRGNEGIVFEKGLLRTVFAREQPLGTCRKERIAEPPRALPRRAVRQNIDGIVCQSAPRRLYDAFQPHVRTGKAQPARVRIGKPDNGYAQIRYFPRKDEYLYRLRRVRFKGGMRKAALRNGILDDGTTAVAREIDDSGRLPRDLVEEDCHSAVFGGAKGQTDKPRAQHAARKQRVFPRAQQAGASAAPGRIRKRPDIFRGKGFKFGYGKNFKPLLGDVTLAKGCRGVPHGKSSPPASAENVAFILRIRHAARKRLCPLCRNDLSALCHGRIHLGGAAGKAVTLRKCALVTETAYFSDALRKDPARKIAPRAGKHRGLRAHLRLQKGGRIQRIKTAAVIAGSLDDEEVFSLPQTLSQSDTVDAAIPVRGARGAEGNELPVEICFVKAVCGYDELCPFRGVEFRRKKADAVQFAAVPFDPYGNSFTEHKILSLPDIHFFTLPRSGKIQRGQAAQQFLHLPCLPSRSGLFFYCAAIGSVSLMTRSAI